MAYSLKQLNWLCEKYGSPLYIFREKEFINNYSVFLHAFQSRYPKYKLSYSYKTNYTPYVCKLVKDQGGFAEVVSDMEYQLARKLGYASDEIIYNGPYKGALSIEHFLNGGILNVDNLQELSKLCRVAEKHTEHRLKMGFRVNIDIGQDFQSRFGMGSEDLKRAFHMVKNISNLSVSGLHCHVGRSRSVKAWENRARIMLEMADKYFDAPPEYIDLGSGMFGRMDSDLAKQFGESELPDYDQYADAVAVLFAEHYQDVTDDKKPILFTEPGTTLVNSYMDFAGKVDSIKIIRGHEIVTLNCSKDNIGEIAKLKRLPISVVHSGAKSEELTDAVFAGYTCLEQDVMYTGYCGNLAVGDYIVFGNVGGYSNVAKPPFILQNCAMVAINRVGNVEIIKREESFNDIFQTYIF